MGCFATSLDVIRIESTQLTELLNNWSGRCDHGAHSIAAADEDAKSMRTMPMNAASNEDTTTTGRKVRTLLNSGLFLRTLKLESAFIGSSPYENCDDVYASWSWPSWHYMNERVLLYYLTDDDE